jgi:hypothetical protein
VGPDGAAGESGKRLGEAVANSLIAKRSPAGEFTLGPVKKALAANLEPAPGVFRFYDPSPAGRAAATFFFTTPILWQPFVIPHAVQFVKDIGRADWPGRTAEMNFTSNLIACPRLNSPLCSREQAATAAAQSSLPNTTSLYDTVVLLAKISVSIHDAEIAQVTSRLRSSTCPFSFLRFKSFLSFLSGFLTHHCSPTSTAFIYTTMKFLLH